MKTIKQAKIHLRENFDEGTDCPCCGQFVKRYKRRLSASPTACLVILYRLHKKHESWERFFHIKEIGQATTTYPFKGGIGGDFAKGAWWGLIEEMEKDPEDETKRTSGFWRLTKKGRRFVRGKATITKYCLTFDAKVLGFTGDQIDVHDCLTHKFNLKELMKR